MKFTQTTTPFPELPSAVLIGLNHEIADHVFGENLDLEQFTLVSRNDTTKQWRAWDAGDAEVGVVTEVVKTGAGEDQIASVVRTGLIKLSKVILGAATVEADEALGFLIFLDQ